MDERRHPFERSRSVSAEFRMIGLRPARSRRSAHLQNKHKGTTTREMRFPPKPPGPWQTVTRDSFPRADKTPRSSNAIKHEAFQLDEVQYAARGCRQPASPAARSVRCKLRAMSRASCAEWGAALWTRSERARLALARAHREAAGQGVESRGAGRACSAHERGRRCPLVRARPAGRCTTWRRRRGGDCEARACSVPARRASRERAGRRARHSAVDATVGRTPLEPASNGVRRSPHTPRDCQPATATRARPLGEGPRRSCPHVSTRPDTPANAN